MTDLDTQVIDRDDGPAIDDPPAAGSPADWSEMFEWLIEEYRQAVARIDADLPYWRAAARRGSRTFVRGLRWTVGVAVRTALQSALLIVGTLASFTAVVSVQAWRRARWSGAMMVAGALGIRAAIAEHRAYRLPYIITTDDDPKPVDARWRPALGALAGTVVVLMIAPHVASGASAHTALGIVGPIVHVDSAPVVLPVLDRRSIVYAADGSTLAVLHGPLNREPVPLNLMAPVLVQSVVDTEDDRYWHHGGVDVHGVLRALATNARAGETKQGGSTIAQQLVKNTLLSPKRDIQRKLKEMVLADRMVRQLGRHAVLERYLNTVYFGNGTYGVEAAAQAYFGRRAAEVSPGQAALLAGLIHDPAGENPIAHPEHATARRATVLDLLVKHGHLQPSDAAAAKAEPIPSAIAQSPSGRDWFTDAVKKELLADPRFGATPQERYHALFAGGLRVYTTLDPGMQQQAEVALAAGIPPGNGVTAALAAVDPATGAVRALVGGPDFSTSQFNAAMSEPGRQPGSAFKVFTLVTALQQGRSPSEVVDGATPCQIPNRGGKPDPWSPDNFEGEQFGAMSITDATVHSVNCAYARLALSVGLANVAQTARDMGVTAKLNAVPSMTLGTNEVPPLQMAAAYATLAADGIARPVHLVERVEAADGHVITKADTGGRRVMSEEVARQATAVLEQVVQRGTGRGAALPGRPVAGKTGTAENYQDAWFVGFAPQLATAVWMGHPEGEVPMRNVGGINVVGGTYPARMWNAFMANALAAQPPVAFTAPAAVTPASGSGAGPGQSWCWTSCGHSGPPPAGAVPEQNQPKHDKSGH